MAGKKLLKEVEAARAGEPTCDLLEWYRWARWGQPVPDEMRPALLFVADALGEPLSPWLDLAELLAAAQGAPDATETPDDADA